MSTMIMNEPMNMNEPIYCGYCSTDADTDTEAETDRDSAGLGGSSSFNSNDNAQILKALPQLVLLKPHPKELGRSSTLMMYQPTRDDRKSSISTWKEKLIQVSNIASFLCVIDCTILPVITLILPLIGLGASPEQEEWLHHMGHKVAMNFVLPVGSLAATMKYSSHKTIFLPLISLLGLSLIFVANSSCHGRIISIFPHHIKHLLHDGVIHRCVNTSGCVLLLLSNFSGRKFVCDDYVSNGFCCFGKRSKRHQD